MSTVHTEASADGGGTLAPACLFNGAVLYDLQQRRIRAMLAWLEAELDVHRQKYDAAADDWSLLSELAEMNTLLLAALVRLSGMEELKVRRALMAMKED